MACLENAEKLNIFGNLPFTPQGFFSPFFLGDVRKRRKEIVSSKGLVHRDQSFLVKNKTKTSEKKRIPYSPGISCNELFLWNLPPWAGGVALVKPIAAGIPSRSSEWRCFWAWLLGNDNVMPRVTGFSLEDLKK